MHDKYILQIPDYIFEKIKKSNLLQTENRVALSNVNIKNKNEQKHRF